MASRPARLLLAALLAVVLAGSCSDGGRDSEADADAEAAQRAGLERQHQAVSTVIVAAYRDGRLGPREEVMAEVARMARDVTPAGVPAPTLFDVEGNLLHYDRLDAAGRVVFTEWVRRSERLQRAVGDEMARARREARAG